MSTGPDYLKFQKKITQIEEERIAAFTSDEQFNDLGIELLKEISSLMIPVASIYRVDDKGNKIAYTYEESALIGNLVRYCKLTNAILEQIKKERLETTLIFFRALSETYITLKYFLKFKDEHTLRHYIKNSLRQEKELIEIIRRNISDKKVVEAIEQRMMESISNSFRDSDFNEEDMSNSSKWDAKLKSRIKEIIHPDFYVLIYGNASHGNWQDLISFHLNKTTEGFFPKLSWTFPALQIITATIILSSDLLYNYAKEVLPSSENKNKLLESIEDIIARAFTLDQQHEIFIQRSSK